MVLLKRSEIQALVEAERSSIAAEIHDGLLPYLFAAAAKLAALRRSAEAAESEFADDLAEVARWVDQSRQVARRLMDGISYPPVALQEPIRAAAGFLDDVLDLSAAPHPPQIKWPWDGEPNDSEQKADPAEIGHSPTAGLPAETAIAIYRLIIECVRNAVRHADASSIVVSAKREGENMVIQIQDDGCGFDTSAAAGEHLHGLALAQHRARMGGVQMEVESSQTPGTRWDVGTRITLTLNLAADPITTSQPLPASGE